MKRTTKGVLGIVILVAFVIPAVLLVDYTQGTGIFTERVAFSGFRCYTHNYTQDYMIPNVRYACFENQTCYSYVLSNGTGVFVMLSECLISYYPESENRTIWCDHAPEECNMAYALKGKEEI